MRLPTQLLHRKTDSNKRDFGHVFILAGSRRFSGAAALCSLAAMRSGAGLVTIGMPESIVNPMIKIKPKEAMILPLPETKEGSLSLSGYKKIIKFIEKIDVVIIGPGLSQEGTVVSLVRKLLAKINKPVVIDADGLNAIAGKLNLLKSLGSRLKGETIITPHPGEMARLLKTTVGKIQSQRKKIALDFAIDYNVTIVLKGNKSVVAGCNGEFYVNNSGNPGMATAGSGDLLTGIIGAFFAQGIGAFNATKYAVYLHGLAGDLAAKEKTQISLIASDIIEKIPEAIKICS